MKKLFTNISEQEKIEILEMHKRGKATLLEQSKPNEFMGTISVGDTMIWDGKKQPEGTEEFVKEIQKELRMKETGVVDHNLIVFLTAQAREGGQVMVSNELKNLQIGGVSQKQI